jgi:hypothetical protein
MLFQNSWVAFIYVSSTYALTCELIVRPSPMDDACDPTATIWAYAEVSILTLVPGDVRFPTPIEMDHSLPPKSCRRLVRHESRGDYQRQHWKAGKYQLYNLIPSWIILRREDWRMENQLIRLISCEITQRPGQGAKLHSGFSLSLSWLFFTAVPFIPSLMVHSVSGSRRCNLFPVRQSCFKLNIFWIRRIHSLMRRRWYLIRSSTSCVLQKASLFQSTALLLKLNY